MKNISIFICLLLIVACSPPTPQSPTSAMAKKSGTEQKTLVRGHAIYVSQCGRCHEPVMPKNVTREDWHTVVPGMAWNAGISKADEKAVTAYILAAKQ